MIVRPVELLDYPRIEELMKRQDWILPDVNDPRFISKLAIDGDGQGVAFGLARTITEAYLVIDPEFRTPAWRWAAIQRLHNEVRDEVVPAFSTKSVTWIPRNIETPYGRRLLSLGWVRQDNPSFCWELT